MFSARVPADLKPNRLTQAIRRVSESGPLIDLTVTNPSIVGLEYPASLLTPLADAAALCYQPSPFGLRQARDAVARDYARRGARVDPNRIVLTASTSEAYSLLFKLLCEPHGDAVLVPVPSYPLFDHLTRLDGVGTTAYPLEYHGGWTIDWSALDAAWTPNVRALLAVSPNNPTGSVISRTELVGLSERCANATAALVIDEVFADYVLEPGLPAVAPELPAGAKAGARELGSSGARELGSSGARELGSSGARELGSSGARELGSSGARELGSSGAREFESLTFRLGGLSKSAGLPQIKLGWIAVDGPERLVADALERLELICDTYLSVSTPVQVAAPALIEGGADVRRRITERVRGNHETLRRLAGDHPAIEVLHADAGWSAVLRLPSTRTEDEIVLELLDREGVLVHPGYFFDFPHEAFVVVSLLPRPDVFHEGVRRLLERADA